MGGKEIYGFPLNMPFVSTQQIWEEVKNTKIHEIIIENVEHALSVCIFPYTNYVLSVWVFIGVIYE